MGVGEWAHATRHRQTPPYRADAPPHAVATGGGCRRRGGRHAHPLTAFLVALVDTSQPLTLHRRGGVSSRPRAPRGAANRGGTRRHGDPAGGSPPRAAARRPPCKPPRVCAGRRSVLPICPMGRPRRGVECTEDRPLSTRHTARGERGSGAAATAAGGPVRRGLQLGKWGRRFQQQKPPRCRPPTTGWARFNHWASALEGRAGSGRAAVCCPCRPPPPGVLGAETCAPPFSFFFPFFFFLPCHAGQAASLAGGGSGAAALVGRPHACAVEVASFLSHHAALAAYARPPRPRQATGAPSTTTSNTLPPVPTTSVSGRATLAASAPPAGGLHVTPGRGGCARTPPRRARGGRRGCGQHRRRWHPRLLPPPSPSGQRPRRARFLPPP